MTAGRKTNSNNKHWNTPEKYVIPIVEFLGGIDLDPCSNEFSIVPAKVKYQLPESNGLKVGYWKYDTIFVNPPYGRFENTSIRDWISRCYLSHKINHSEVIALIPVATNTRHWKLYIFGKASICFLEDTRLKFTMNGIEDKKGAPMACALVYWGGLPGKFKQNFEQYGYVVQ